MAKRPNRIFAFKPLLKTAMFLTVITPVHGQVYTNVPFEEKFVRK